MGTKREHFVVATSRRRATHLTIFLNLKVVGAHHVPLSVAFALALGDSTDLCRGRGGTTCRLRSRIAVCENDVGPICINESPIEVLATAQHLPALVTSHPSAESLVVP